MLEKKKSTPHNGAVMRGATTEKELIALEFNDDEGLLYCLQILEKERPILPISLPGRKSVIIPKEEASWLEKRIKEKKHHFSEAAVVNASEIPPKQIAALRAKYFSDRKTAFPDATDQTWKQKRIQELKKEL